MKFNFLKQATSFVTLLRPINLLMIVAIFWLVQYFIFEPFFAQFGFGLSLKSAEFDAFTFSAVLVAIGGYLINDWFDRDIDSINKPNRFLVNHGSRFQVFSSYLSLNALALIISIYLFWVENNAWATFIVVLYAGMFFWYAARLKKMGFAGNLLISFLVGLIPWCVCVLNLESFRMIPVGSNKEITDLVMHLSVFSGLMFFISLARELAKDAEDAEGDKSQGVKSIFLKNGLRFTRNLISTSVLFVLVLEFALLLDSNWISLSFFYLTFFAILVQLLLLVYIFKTNDLQRFKKISLWLKVVMLLGMIQIAMLSPT